MSGNGHVPNGNPGDVVFVLLNEGLADTFRESRFPVLDYHKHQGKPAIKFVDERRPVYVYSDMMGSTIEACIRRDQQKTFQPYNGSTVNLRDDFGFTGKPAEFGEWIKGQVAAGQFVDASDFLTKADSRAKPWPEPVRQTAKPKAKPAVAGKTGPAQAQQPQSEFEKEVERQLADYKPKTFGEIVQSVGELVHLWLNWLVIGNLSLIYSKPKQGKTRIYIRIIKTLWFAERWADGADNPWPAGTKTLILPYDRNHQEIAAEMKRMGIPDAAAVCPHDPRDQTGVSLLSLTDPWMLAIMGWILDKDKTVKLVVVDTLTYASEKSLSKPEDMKAILDSIITLAVHFAVAVLVLIHENKEGEALGRRICERARVLIKLERYSESDPTRLRLYVKESNFKERPALTVVHKDNGIEFEKDAGQAGGTADRRDACARWLAEYLWAKGVNVEVDYGTLIGAAGDAGFAGDLAEDGRRWSNPKLLDRAIKAINDEVESLEELKKFKVLRREQTKFGRSRPVVFYWLTAEGMPDVAAY